MEINAQKKFFSERDALILLMEETGKAIDQMDMTLIKECLYFLYPENEEEDRVYIERTLPILHEKLGFNRPAKAVRRSRPRMALVAVLVVLGVLMLASVVAYAFGINVLNFFIYDTKEYWMIHVKTPEAIETVAPDLPASLTDYDVWGEAVARSIEEMNVYPALPKMIPDGYEYVSSMNTAYEGFYNEESFLYEHSNGLYFKLIVRSMEYDHVETESHVQKEEANKNTVFISGIEVAIAENYDSVSATWMSNNCNVRITGTCSIDELEMMVNSL